MSITKRKADRSKKEMWRQRKKGGGANDAMMHYSVSVKTSAKRGIILRTHNPAFSPSVCLSPPSLRSCGLNSAGERPPQP